MQQDNSLIQMELAQIQVMLRGLQPRVVKLLPTQFC